MNAELERRRSEIEAILRRADVFRAELTPEQFNWRPSPGQWSVGQCLAHLTAANGLMLESLERKLDSLGDKAARGGGPFRYGWISRWFVQTMEPPAKIKIKTQARVAPSPDIDPELALREFHEIHRNVVVFLERCDGLDLAKIRIQSPFLKILSYELGPAFAVICAHDRRHLWQAEEVVKSPDFPR